MMEPNISIDSSMNNYPYHMKNLLEMTRAVLVETRAEMAQEKYNTKFPNESPFFDKFINEAIHSLKKEGILPYDYVYRNGKQFYNSSTHENCNSFYSVKGAMNHWKEYTVTVG